MTQQTGRLIYLIATLPGVLIPFVPYEFDTRPIELLSDIGDISSWRDVALLVGIGVVFAPLAIVLTDTWWLLRRSRSRVISGLVAAFALLTSVGWGCVYLQDPTGIFGLPDVARLVGLVGLGGVAGLVLYGYRRRLFFSNLASMSLMGAYVAATVAWAVGPGVDEWGGYLGLYICPVFVVRIVDLLRSRS